MFQTLGGLVREKRAEQGMTQHDVCALLGWRDVSKLGDIEQGKAMPDLETCWMIFGALEFTQEERGHALLLLGELPSKEEAEQQIADLREFVDNWDYPAYLTDFTWRLYYGNGEAIRYFGLQGHDELVDSWPNILELALDEESPAYRYFHAAKNWPQLLAGQIANFRSEHLRRTSERWFRELLARLLRYPEFADIWSTLEATNVLRISRLKKVSGYNSVVFPSPGGDSTEAYYIFSCPVVGDERFRVSMSVPRPAAQEGLARLTEKELSMLARVSTRIETPDGEAAPAARGR